jgi:hypothetical protein
VPTKFLFLQNPSEFGQIQLASHTAARYHAITCRTRVGGLLRIPLFNSTPARMFAATPPQSTPPEPVASAHENACSLNQPAKGAWTITIAAKKVKRSVEPYHCRLSQVKFMLLLLSKFTGQATAHGLDRAAYQLLAQQPYASVGLSIIGLLGEIEQCLHHLEGPMRNL